MLAAGGATGGGSTSSGGSSGGGSGSGRDVQVNANCIMTIHKDSAQKAAAADLPKSEPL
jgi:hypothetical protein